ncbi:phosphodiesterase [Salinivirga cyanobacteriivorans]|uniref:Phosphoesterase n=1 Tax=Salinivirga cyanobacteriivorans TaxID=1307839 RepID=A0A0S2HVV9_9BACT|nr:metallophosphoesterase family protein [Salinivirga cyanobacteriivorans]ALO14185.1 phosphodiesterase [Salinivirga cyanobacteriivorans]
MYIGLISDTHGFLHPAAQKHLKDVDEIWHAGDIGSLQVLQKLEESAPVRAVFGNIDDAGLRRQLPEILNFKIGNYKILMTHIGGYPGKYAPGIRQILYERKPDLFISGHSHILKVKPDQKFNLLHINPGAAGLQGFHQVCTLVRFRITNTIEDLEVVEFPKKRS